MRRLNLITDRSKALDRKAAQHDDRKTIAGLLARAGRLVARGVTGLRAAIERAKLALERIPRRKQASAAPEIGVIAGKPPVRSLWDDLRPLLGSLAVFSFFINLLFLVPAIFMQQVFDRVLASRSHDTLIVLLVGAGLAMVILLMLDFLRNRLQNVAGNIVDERLSPPIVHTIVAKAARAPQSASLEGIRDVAALRQLFSANGLNALLDAPWAVVYVVVIWLFHPALGIGAAVAAIFMLGLAWLNDRVSRRSLEGLQKDGRRASQYVENSLRNAEVLQALGMTENLLSRWRMLQDRVTLLQGRANRSGAAFTAMTRFSRQAIQILMLALGAYLVLTEFASPGIMIATTIILGRAVQPVEQLVGSWRMLTDARAAYRRLRELSEEFDTGPARLTMPRPTGRLSSEAISFCAPGGDKKLILNNVAFTLAPGEALAIVGPSAAGKSTLTRLLTGVWTPTSGTVRLDGVDVAYWPRHDLGPWIGYMPQDVELFEGTVADNIARLGQVDSEAVVAAANRAGTHELILALPQGYDTQVGEHGSRLSPGQRQRIAFARALYGQPRLVVLDEPNSNLDGAGEIALAQALSELRKEGVTSIVVTHRPSLIAHVDKILVLDSGRVQHFGPAAEAMKAMQIRAQVA